MKKVRLTKDQKVALAAYNFAVAKQDRYLGSVFVTDKGQKDLEKATQLAYEKCKALGMDHNHGL